MKAEIDKRLQSDSKKSKEVLMRDYADEMGMTYESVKAAYYYEPKQ